MSFPFMLFAGSQTMASFPTVLFATIFTWYVYSVQSEKLKRFEKDEQKGQENEVQPFPLDNSENANDEDDAFVDRFDRSIPYRTKTETSARDPTAIVPMDALSERNRQQNRFGSMLTGKSNNDAPNERVNVGPGLGVSAYEAAVGGFQQFYRVAPINVNADNLTQLEGRVTGPKVSTTGFQRTADFDAVTKNRPPKAFAMGMPARVAAGRGQHEKTIAFQERMAHGVKEERATGTLAFGGKAKVVPEGGLRGAAHTQIRDDDTSDIYEDRGRLPVRTKTGKEGYEVTPLARYINSSSKYWPPGAQEALGIRTTDKRENHGRVPNPNGNFNIPVCPVTRVRSDDSRGTLRTRGADASGQQRYVPISNVRLNTKTTVTDRTTTRELDTIRNQLDGNPYAIPAFASWNT